jgi:acyl-CoA thioester hydrolase
MPERMPPGRAAGSDRFGDGGMSAPAQAISGWRDGWYVVPGQVTFRDVDFFGHVNNAVYFTFFEWGRTRYWLEMMGTTRPEAIGFIVAHAECDFRRQLDFGQEIEICTKIGELRNRSLDFLCEIRKSNGGEVAAIGKVVIVMFDWKSQTTIPIDAELRERIAGFQTGGEV